MPIVKTMALVTALAEATVMVTDTFATVSNDHDRCYGYDYSCGCSHSPTHTAMIIAMAAATAPPTRL